MFIVRNAGFKKLCAGINWKILQRYILAINSIYPSINATACVSDAL